MPAYDICYLEEDGALLCAFTVQFENEMRAKILAHAMKPADCHRLEVWRGRDLVYRRPESFAARRPGESFDAHRPDESFGARRPDESFDARRPDATALDAPSQPAHTPLHEPSYVPSPA